MKQRRILVDLDATGVDLYSEWLGRFNALYGTRLTTADITDWEIDNCVPPELRGKVEPLLDEPGLFRGLKALPGFIDGVRALHDDGNEVVIATAARGGQAAKEKIDWCLENLPFLGGKKGILIGHKKYVFKGDALVDDGPHNCIEYRAEYPNAQIVSIGYPFNSAGAPACDLYIPDGWKDMAASWSQIVDFFRRNP